MPSIFLVTNFHSTIMSATQWNVSLVIWSAVIVLYTFFEITNRFWLLFTSTSAAPQKKKSSRFKSALLAGQQKWSRFEITRPLNLPLRKSMTSLIVCTRHPCPILLKPKAFFPLDCWHDMGFEDIEEWFRIDVFMEPVARQQTSIDYSRPSHHLCLPKVWI